VSDGARFVLGVDLDGVCGDYIGSFRKIVAERRGVPVESLTMDVSWGCAEWGIQGEDEFDVLHRHAVLERGLLRHMDLIPGAAEALWRLSDAGVWIRIVTHRLYVNWGHAVAAGDTAEWLDDARIPYRDLCFIAAKSSVDADAFVEDAPHNIEALRAAGHTVIVFDQPYNRGLPGPRAAGWGEAEEIVRDLVVERTGSFPMQLPGIDPGADRLERRLYRHPTTS
jgi:5'(3')-deoxyribonucleotidase